MRRSNLSAPALLLCGTIMGAVISPLLVTTISDVTRREIGLPTDPTTGYMMLIATVVGASITTLGAILAAYYTISQPRREAFKVAREQFEYCEQIASRLVKADSKISDMIIQYSGGYEGDAPEEDRPTIETLVITAQNCSRSSASLVKELEITLSDTVENLGHNLPPSLRNRLARATKTIRELVKYSEEFCLVCDQVAQRFYTEQKKPTQEELTKFYRGSGSKPLLIFQLNDDIKSAIDICDGKSPKERGVGIFAI